MRAIVEAKKVTLTVNGREMSFSKEELTKILEQHFNEKTEIVQGNVRKVAMILDEGKYFNVNPHLMELRFFEEAECKNTLQEWTRDQIVEVLKEVRRNPKKYAKPFKIKWVKKEWEIKTLKELKEMAVKEGEHATRRVHQVLEWAQRIVNGETWEAVCNAPDTAEHYRLVQWDDDEWRVIGGSKKANHNSPASSMDYSLSNDDARLEYTTISVVSYD